MESEIAANLRERVEDRIKGWQVAVERRTETASSVLVFGHRENHPVVLKVVKSPGDEWHSGAVLDAFEGRGVVRVYEYVEGAMLLEWLKPGESLVDMVLSGAEDRATALLAETIWSMSPGGSVDGVPTVKDWGRGFERYLASGDAQVSRYLVEPAQRLYQELCGSQKHVRLLHGDLHHYNVLLDADRGWLAIDPKGVIGELEYETGAALRNPYERPELFAAPPVIGKRIKHFACELGLDEGRVVSWGFAQAVLSAIWSIEDGFRLEPDNGAIALAKAMWPMLDDPGGR